MSHDDRRGFAEHTVANGISRRELVRRGSLGGAALMLPSLLVACGGDGSPDTNASTDPSAPKRGGRLRSAHQGVGEGRTDSMDPHNPTGSIYEIARDAALFDTLTKYNPDLTVRNHLADTLEPNADGTVWQLRLKDGVGWHDGKPLTTADVIYTWERLLGPDNDFPLTLASYINAIDLERTKVVDKLTIDIQMKRPVGDLATLFVPRELSIIQEGSTVESFKQPIGTGPFKFVEWRNNRYTHLERNPDYFVSGRPYVDELELNVIDDPQARINALLGGQVDMLQDLPATQAKAQADNDAIKIVNAESSFTTALPMRVDAKPFDDNRVREAFRLAIDREQLVDVVTLGYGSIGNDLLGKGTQYYNDQLPQRPYDPEKAKALLKQAGYDSIDISVAIGPWYPAGWAVANTFAEQGKAANINLKVQNIGTDAYMKHWLIDPLAISDWAGGLELIGSQCCTSKATQNDTAWKRPEWDEIFNSAQAEVDDDKRKALYYDLHEMMYEEGGYILPIFRNIIDAMSAKVGGVEPHSYYNLGDFAWDQMWLA